MLGEAGVADGVVGRASGGESNAGGGKADPEEEWT